MVSLSINQKERERKTVLQQPLKLVEHIYAQSRACVDMDLVGDLLIYRMKNEIHDDDGPTAREAIPVTYREYRSCD